jgi:FKBP-type peptidyl-prolyl cis-trans isomerase
MRQTISFFTLSSLLLLAACQAQEPTTPPSDSLEDQAGYILGHDIGFNVHHQLEDLEGRGTIVSQEAVMAGFRAGLRGDSLHMSQETVDSIMVAFQEQVMQQVGTASRAEGEAFLQQFEQQEGVTTTESGLRYRVIEQGEGEPPGPDDVVSVHYEGRLPNGQVFDSSIQRGQPVRFPVQGVVPGFSEALQLMSPGAQYEIVLPPELGYGDQAPPSIGPGQTLIFTVELLEVERQS